MVASITLGEFLVLQHIKSTESWNEKSLGAKGFTLIELLVVIVILGILAAVVVFAVGGITNKGQKEACRTEARTVRTAEEAKYAQDSTYASSNTLVSEKFLSKAPTLVTVSGANATTYNIAYAGKCLTEMGGEDA